MNFYGPPPTVTASLFVRIPDSVRCTDRDSEWRGGFSRPFQNIFLEGPVYSSDGNLYVVDIPYGRILKISEEKEVSIVAEWDGEPNGLAVDAEGKIAIADYKQGILSLDPSLQTSSSTPLKPTPLLPRHNLERFKGPNDLIYSSTGDLYFTDQGQTGLTDQTGRVYRLSPAGKLDTLVSNGVSPNGLVLSPDEKFLFVAMTRQNSVWRLPLHADGTTSKAGLFFQSFGTAGPDGLAMDEKGRLFVCHPSLGSVFVVNPDGTPYMRIVSGTGGVNLTNCCFGGSEGRTLFVTDSLEGCVQMVEWECKGAGKVPTVRSAGS